MADGNGNMGVTSVMVQGIGMEDRLGGRQGKHPMTRKASRAAVVFVLCLLAAADAVAAGIVKIDPGNAFQGGVDRMDVYAKVLGTSNVQTVIVGPGDILDGADDRRKTIEVPAGAEFLLYAQSYAADEFRFPYLAFNLGDLISLGEGQEVVAEMTIADVRFVPDSFAIHPGETAALSLTFQAPAKPVIEVNRSVYQVVFTIPDDPEPVGELEATLTGYAFTAGATPGTYGVKVRVSVDGHSMHPYDVPSSVVLVTIFTSALKSPGGVAVDRVGNIYVSDSEDGTVVMNPKGEEGLRILTDLDHPGDIDIGPYGRSLIVAEANGRISRHVFGLSGRLRDESGAVIVGARVIAETPFSGTPGLGDDKSRFLTDGNGEFHIFGLLREEEEEVVNVSLTFQYMVSVWHVEIPIGPEGHTFWDFTLNASNKLRIEMSGEGTVQPPPGVHEYPRNLTVDIGTRAAPNWETRRITGDVTDELDPRVPMTRDSYVHVEFAPVAK